MGKSTISMAMFNSYLYVFHCLLEGNIRWKSLWTLHKMGLSENSVPLDPMVLLIIIPTKWLAIIGGILHFQTYQMVYPIKSH